MSHAEWLVARQRIIDGEHADRIKRDDEHFLAALRVKFPDLATQQQPKEEAE